MAVRGNSQIAFLAMSYLLSRVNFIFGLHIPWIAGKPEFMSGSITPSTFRYLVPDFSLNIMYHFTHT